MRLPALLLPLWLVAEAAAQQPEPRGDGAPPAVVEVFGSERWAELPRWRQEMITERWRRFAELPPDRQQQIRAEGLAEFLAKPEHDFGLGRVPARLREFVAHLPAEVRGLAGKLVVMRLRQHRLDRNLGLLPREQRRPLFRRLFPEPFEAEPARAAGGDLDAEIARVMAARVRSRLTEEEAKRGAAYEGAARITRASEMIREVTREEEESINERVLSELSRLGKRDGPAAREFLEREGFYVFERIELIATPRQRELLRYALRPADCPFLDFPCLGERPADPRQRRRWEEDFRVLARLDLLTEAGFPTEVVLHLAASGSPEDLFRAVKVLRGRPEPSPRPPGDGPPPR